MQHILYLPIPFPFQSHPRSHSLSETSQRQRISGYPSRKRPCLYYIHRKRTRIPQLLTEVYLHSPLLLRSEASGDLCEVEVCCLHQGLDVLDDVVCGLALKGFSLKGLDNRDKDLARLTDGGRVLPTVVSICVRMSLVKVQELTAQSTKQGMHMHEARPPHR